MLIFFEYYKNNSVINKINPIVRMLWLVVVSFIVLFAKDILFLLFILTLTITIQFLTKISFKIIYYFCIYLILFVLLAFILIVITYTDILVGVVFLTKVSILTILAFQFSLTTTKKEMIVSLVKFRVPYSFAFSFAIALRFFPKLIYEAKEVINAQQTRAHKIRINIFKVKESINSFEPLIIPLLNLLLKKSFYLSLSADLRGFNPSIYSRIKLRFRVRDYLVICILFIIILFSWQRT